VNGSSAGKGLSIASMVLGIVALVPIIPIPFSGTVVAIVGLILGVVGKKQLKDAGAPTGMATAGIVMSIIALVLSVIVAIACASCIGALSSGLMALD
jgi:hypothetical protein